MKDRGFMMPPGLDSCKYLKSSGESILYGRIVYDSMWALYESIQPSSPWHRSKESTKQSPFSHIFCTHAASHISV